MPVVDIGQAGPAIEKAMMSLIDEGTKALKIEAGVELGDRLAHTQRRDTSRLSASTSVAGRQMVKHDPGAGFHMPASRIELLQSAESTIPFDPPPADAHVSEGAGVLEGQEYGGYVEARFKTAEKAIGAVEADTGGVISRAGRRAERALKGRI